MADGAGVDNAGGLADGACVDDAGAPEPNANVGPPDVDEAFEADAPKPNGTTGVMALF